MQDLSTTQTICFVIVAIFGVSSWLQLSGFLAFGRSTTSKLQFPGRISWFIMQAPNLFWVCYFAYKNNFQLNLPMTLFMIHYVNRTIIFPLRSQSNSYMPLQASSMAFLFTSINGYLQYKGNTRFGFKQDITLEQIIGIFIFAAGMIINVISDEILRIKRSKSTEKAKYTNTDDFLFKYVTMANYFGEMIEWFGYAAVAQTPASLLFAFGTLSFLLSAGIARHRWNLANIPKYPKNKKAVIPFLI